ncbi:MAG: hypothetical protein EZS28_050765, partial [Streblomastix strix]
MIIRRASLIVFLEDIVKGQEGDDRGRPILIICSTDIDSLAACTIICDYFIKNSRLFNLFPVSSAEALESFVQNEYDISEGMKYVLLINVGAGIDLKHTILNNNKQTLVIVLDSLRPYERHNADVRERQILLVDDISSTGERDYAYSKQRIFIKRKMERQQKRMQGILQDDEDEDEISIENDSRLDDDEYYHFTYYSSPTSLEV